MTDKLVSARTIVEAPPAVVFAILADPRQHARVDGSGTVGSVVTGPERLSAAGDTFTVGMKMYGVPYKMTNRVVEFDPDRRIAWRHVGAHRWRYELEPTDDGGTQVTETFDYSRFHPLGQRVFELLGIPKRNEQAITETLGRLKRAAEQDALGSASR